MLWSYANVRSVLISFTPDANGRDALGSQRQPATDNKRKLIRLSRGQRRNMMSAQNKLSQTETKSVTFHTDLNNTSLCRV